MIQIKVEHLPVEPGLKGSIHKMENIAADQYALKLGKDIGHIKCDQHPEETGEITLKVRMDKPPLIEWSRYCCNEMKLKVDMSKW